MKKCKIRRTMVIVFLLATMVNNSNSQSGFMWGRQLGSTKDEYVMNHVIDGTGNIYIAGKTTGIMNEKNNGGNDGFITKIDSLGNIIWTKQFGSDGEEDVLWSAIDNTGCVYITGSTTGILADKKSGKEDIFIVKYNPRGEMEWMRQYGTDSTDVARGIYADSKGSVYLTGMTGGRLGQNSFGKTDAFIMKLDKEGQQLKTLQFGTTGDDCAYAITGGNNSDIFVCGTTWGDMAGKNKGFIDGFTGQFTAGLDPVRYNQFGSEGFDIAMILHPDNEKNIYVGGSTSGNFGAEQIGEGDGFLLKINEKGDVLWNNQFGTKT